MRLAARSSSSAPVTTRRTSRTRSHFLASSSLRQAGSSSGKVSRWTEPSRPGSRASHASSAVNDRIGASQATSALKISSMTVSAARRFMLE